jgi:chemotaxis response regulator CheB
MSIRVCICEDDPVFRRLLIDYINKESDMKVVGASSSKLELMEVDGTAIEDYCIVFIRHG